MFWFNILYSNSSKNFGSISNLGTLLYLYDANTIKVLKDTPYEVILSTSEVPLSTYNHLALVITATGCTVFVNGVQKTVGTRPNSNYIQFIMSATTFYAGTCIIDELRISNIARYNSDFTVELSPFETPRFS